MYKCGLCNAELNTLDEYLKHTQTCVKEQKFKEEDIQKMNEALNRVKAAKEYYEKQLAEFEKNYPEAYKLNFGEKKCQCNKKTEAESQPKMRSFSLESDKDGVKVNGKKVSKEEAKLAEDAFVKSVCQLLGLE